MTTVSVSVADKLQQELQKKQKQTNPASSFGDIHFLAMYHANWDKVLLTHVTKVWACYWSNVFTC